MKLKRKWVKDALLISYKWVSHSCRIFSQVSPFLSNFLSFSIVSSEMPQGCRPPHSCPARTPAGGSLDNVTTTTKTRNNEKKYTCHRISTTHSLTGPRDI
ncbi:hypothetical protein E2C01_067914 [Portunus trituberculatus]|uniref:Uncharacterized protein n=1 Tax=Portunus trituberculatus TaxID=210409 RepID=A0A5B7HMC6_PORTR|nr:hypothetical protein [Portunus trituberculatus]